MAAPKQTNPLTWNVPIVDKSGNPTPEFMRKWLQQQDANSDIVILKTPSDISAVLDLISKTHGAVLFRGATMWTVLLPGTSGQALTTQGTDADPAWATVASAALAGFGFFSGGLIGNKEVLGSGIFPVDMTFTTGDPDTIAECVRKPTATAVLNLVIAGSGVDTVVGTVTYTTGSFIGAVAWASSPYTLPAGTRMWLLGPSPPDPTLAAITGTINGVPS